MPGVLHCYINLQGPLRPPCYYRMVYSLLSNHSQVRRYAPAKHDKNENVYTGFLAGTDKVLNLLAMILAINYGALHL